MDKNYNKEQYNLLQSAFIFGLGIGVGFLTNRLLNVSRAHSISYIKPPADSRELNFNTRSRYANFIARPYFMKVAYPVPTEVTFTPLLTAPPHRILLSLPGNPPYEREIPNNEGSYTITFTPPENPNNTEDLGEVWFECQPLPVEARLDPYKFQSVDKSESTPVRPVVKYISKGVGELKFVADLKKPLEATFARLNDTHLAQVCADCAIAVAAGAGGGFPDRNKMVVGAALAAAASADCRACIKNTGEKIITHMEKQVKEAHEQMEKQRREVEAREAHDRFREMDRMNNACEQLERWKDIA